MERLTCTDKPELKPWVHSTEAVKRLDAYEDTGLEPEAVEAMKTAMMGKSIAEIKELNGITIDRLCELAQAEKEGRLVVLPCKVGDKMDKKILDVTCGSRSIWFNKHHPSALYCDKRAESEIQIWKSRNGKSKRFCTVAPDVLCDFTSLPFPSNAFSLVVFDPPHLTSAKETSWLVKKYGKLDDAWSKMLHDGFAECMRVLKPDGVLIFKWSEHDIPAKNVWRAIGQKPLFGHHSGKQSKTFWGCFMKFGDEAALEAQKGGEY